MTAITKQQKKEVQKIITDIDDRIPIMYVQGVQKILEEKLKRVSTNRIRATRQGRVFDLDVAQALEQLVEQSEN